MPLGGDYGTALCAACANGKVEVVNALLLAGARRNGDDAQLESGEHFGAPLHIAVLMENREMVNLLIGDNPNGANCTWVWKGSVLLDFRRFPKGPRQMYERCGVKKSMLSCIFSQKIYFLGFFSILCYLYEAADHASCSNKIYVFEAR
ncbi:hypothetical protein B0H14DRAFT_2581142 [Mycena olivaceomarginata]|nr:hypothetical protein B0H14DRAFT_2581142 [Mycena olivaceomarginata]